MQLNIMKVHAGQLAGLNPFAFPSEDPQIESIRKQVLKVFSEGKAGETAEPLTLGELFEEKNIERIIWLSNEQEKEFKEIKKFLEKYKDTSVQELLNPFSHLFVDLRKYIQNPRIIESKMRIDSEESEFIQELYNDIFGTGTEEAIKKNETAILQKIEKVFEQDSHLSEDYVCFKTLFGAQFFYWMEECFKAHLLAKKNLLVNVNKVKQEYPFTDEMLKSSAECLSERLKEADSSVFFAAGCEGPVKEIFQEKQLFKGLEEEGKALVFLNPDQWENSYEVHAESCPGSSGSMQIIVATKKDSRNKFMLASCHVGFGDEWQEIQTQINYIVEEFKEAKSATPSLQLIIGMGITQDGYTKEQLNEYLKEKGLVGSLAEGNPSSCIITLAQEEGVFSVGLQEVLEEESSLAYRVTQATIQCFSKGIQERIAEPLQQGLSIEYDSQENPANFTFESILEGIYRVWQQLCELFTEIYHKLTASIS